jgi:hypothetical protein
MVTQSCVREFLRAISGATRPVTDQTMVTDLGLFHTTIAKVEIRYRRILTMPDESAATVRDIIHQIAGQDDTF